MDTVGASQRKPFRWSWVAVLVSALLIRVPFLLSPITVHHGWRQSQTAWTIRQFARFNPDLLRPEVPIFGARSQVVYEFPLFQALASLFVRIGVTEVLAGRVLHLGFFGIATWLTFLICRSICDERRARIAVLFMAFSPFTLFWSTSVMMEYFVVAGVLGVVWLLLRWRHEFRFRWLGAATLLYCLCSASKLTTAAIWGPVILATIVSAHGGRWLRKLAAAGLVSGSAAGVGIGWTIWADHVKSSHALTTVLSGAKVTELNNELRSELLSVSVLGRPFSTMAAEQLTLVGCLAFGFAIVMLMRGRQTNHRLILAAMSVAPLVGIVLFPVQFKVHDYYTAAVSPLLFIVAAFGWTSMTDLLQRISRKPHLAMNFVRVTSMLGVVFLSGSAPLVRGMLGGQYKSVQQLDVLALEVQQATRTDEVVGIVATTWDPSLSFLADRPAIIDYSNDPVVVKTWNDQRISTLVVTWDRPELLSQLDREWISAESQHILKLADTSDSSAARLKASNRLPPNLPLLGKSSQMLCGSSPIQLNPGERHVAVFPADLTSTLVRLGDLAPVPARRYVVLGPKVGDELTCTGPAPVSIELFSTGRS